MQITNFYIQRDNRLNIEIAQSSRRIAEESRRDNLLNIELAKATAQVAEETRQDSAAMKTIAVLTLTFLPGTFIAVSPLLRTPSKPHTNNPSQSFFSMNDAFTFNPEPGAPIASPNLWIFFAVTIPVTIATYGLWLWWHGFSQTRHKVRHEQGLKDVEKELKQRMRSATTMTW
jgi:hypothetical protein